MKTATITLNGGSKAEVITGLVEGQKLRAKGHVTSRDDVGMSGQTFTYSAFLVGREYIVDHLFRWDGVLIGYVADESGTLHIARSDIFELI